MDEWTLNDLLECSVCLERLDTSSKVLPCQHTFCKKCLEEIVSTHKELRCPECRVLVDAKIDELPPNVLLMRILEGMRNAGPRKLNIGPGRVPGNCLPTPTQHVQNTLQQVNALPDITQSTVKLQAPPNLPYARALYDYRSKEPGDLSFKKGDIIILRKKIDTNWYHGEHGGQIGAFPLTYVQVITPLPTHVPQCKALYDFRMTNEEEDGCLTFSKGELITVIRRVDENWAEGKLGERIGIFPLAFVELNHVARALMKLSTNSQPGPSRLAPPTPTSEDTTPLIPTDHSRTVSSIPPSQLQCITTPAVSHTQHLPQPVAAAPLASHQLVSMVGASDSSSTVSSGSSSTTTPNTSSSNTSSSSSTAPSSPTSPPPPRTTQNVTVSPLPHNTVTPVPPRPIQNSSPSSFHAQQRDKRHSFSVLHTGHHHQSSHRHSAEILSPTEPLQDGANQDQAHSSLQHNSSGEMHRDVARHHRSGSSDLTGSPPPPPPLQGNHHSPGSSVQLPAAYIALYPYKPQKADELELRKGGIYMVTERCQDGWFKGTSKRTQKCGVFPGNYVTPAKGIPGLQSQLRGMGRSVAGNNTLQLVGPTMPHNNLTPPVEARSAAGFTGNKQPPTTLPYIINQRPLAHNGLNVTGVHQSQIPPELPPRATSPNQSSLGQMQPHCMTSMISSSWHGRQQQQHVSSETATNISNPLGRSQSAVMASEATPVRNHNVSLSHHASTLPIGSSTNVSATVSREKVKEKKEKGGVSLMRRLTSMKKSKSPPPPTTYSMDNPVFEDGVATASPTHPVHVRSGSCPSQLLQVMPIDASSGTAHHRLFGSSSQRLKHKERPNVILANLSHSGRSSEPITAGSSSNASNQHRKSNSLDGSAMDTTKKSKQLVPPVRERFRCIVPYPPNSDYELELRVGDIIYVHKKRDDGWYKGTQQRTGRTGLFPASFVESF